jgi:Myosin head (motor domain)
LAGRAGATLPLINCSSQLPHARLSAASVCGTRAQQVHAKHPYFVLPSRKNCPDPEVRNCFGVLHYAGEVFYNVRGFLDKNRDALHPDVIEVMQVSGAAGFAYFGRCCICAGRAAALCGSLHVLRRCHLQRES